MYTINGPRCGPFMVEADQLAPISHALFTLVDYAC